MEMRSLYYLSFFTNLRIRVTEKDCLWKMNMGTATPTTRANKIKVAVKPFLKMDTIISTESESFLH